MSLLAALRMPRDLLLHAALTGDLGEAKYIATAF
ncbi:MAG: hypothetical protein JWR51_1652 [Devosia sp.]|nr:hypothetical protein [Devosia sp.]